MICLVRLICTTAISLGPICMLFTTLDWLLSLPVDHSRQPVALKWDGESLGLVSTVFLGKYLIWELIIFFLLIKKIFLSNKIKCYQNTKQYIFYWLMSSWIVVGRVPVTGMLAGMNLSKPGMNLSKPGMNLSNPGKKHNNHVIIDSNINASYINDEQFWFIFIWKYGTMSSFMLWIPHFVYHRTAPRKQ